MLDTIGPGAVVRIFAEHPQGTLRIYLDGSETPFIEEDAAKFLGGQLAWRPPLNAMTVQGWNSYVPIPYSKSCLITIDGPPIAYEIDYRTYEPPTTVITLTQAQIDKNARLINGLQRGLRIARSPKGGEIANGQKVLMAGDSKIFWEIEEPGAISEISLQVEAQDGNKSNSLRSLILKIEFDDAQTVWCPVSDFFLNAPEVMEYTTWRTAADENWLQARWYMPYHKNARITIENHGTVPVRIRNYIRYRPDYVWDDQRTMYFHADWAFNERIPTRPQQDWNVIEITGQGVFVGDGLVVTNPSQKWWGNGAPKIYVDHEEFPSTFGTSMDHYYGYGKHSSQPFASPFHSRPRCDGPGSYGQSAASRLRGLDVIPFEKHLKFDLGIGHDDPDVDVAYAATIFWYGKAGATANLKPVATERLQAMPAVKIPGPSFKREGVIEGEELAVARMAPQFNIFPQHLWRAGLFSQDFQLLGDARTVGARADIAIPITEPGRYHIKLQMTKGPTYGMVYFWLDEKDTGIAADLFNEANPYDIDPAEIIDLGIHEVTSESAEEIMLGIEVIGNHDDSAYPYFQWGLDSLTIEKLDD